MVETLRVEADMTNEQREEWNALVAELAGSMLKRFGEAWADDGAEPSTDRSVIGQKLLAYAMPLTAAALEAVACFIFETAPPDATVEQFRATMMGNAEEATRRVVQRYASTGRRIGEFWHNVEEHLHAGHA